MQAAAVVVVKMEESVLLTHVLLQYFSLTMAIPLNKAKYPTTLAHRTLQSPAEQDQTSARLWRIVRPVTQATTEYRCEKNLLHLDRNQIIWIQIEGYGTQTTFLHLAYVEPLLTTSPELSLSTSGPEGKNISTLEVGLTALAARKRLVEGLKNESKGSWHRMQQGIIKRKEAEAEAVSNEFSPSSSIASSLAGGQKI
ncbi:hypothetical protein DFH27DRAFT_605472 [Peziza echinospora]|nr:hypothetical protein DFH27DRAFT_605472 [Peziza echinospora]